MRGIRALYRKAAEELAERLVAEPELHVNAVVLYGSVARGTATKDSDVDVLIVCSQPDRIRTRVAEIEVDIDAVHGYYTWLTSMYYTPDQLEAVALKRFPFVSEVLREGIPLYDDGTYSRVRDEAFADGGRDAVGRQADGAKPPAKVR